MELLCNVLKIDEFTSKKGNVLKKITLLIEGEPFKVLGGKEAVGLEKGEQILKFKISADQFLSPVLKLEGFQKND